MRIALLATLVCFGAVAASAVVIDVPADQPTITAALLNSMPGDEIVLEPGLYQESPLLCAWGITIRSATPGEYVEIDLMGGPALTIACSGSAVDLSWLMIRNGGNGGLILAPDPYAGIATEASVSHCIITQNHGDTGGILISRRPPDSAGITISNCEISENTSSGDGAGLFAGSESNNCTVTLSNVMFRENVAVGRGGGIFTLIPLQASGCQFNANQAFSGGGLYSSMLYPAGVLDDCVFTNNQAAQQGGGFYAGMDGGLEFHHCNFEQNSASAGDDGWVSSMVTVLVHCCSYQDGGLEIDPDAVGELVIDDSDCGVASEARSWSGVKGLFR